MQSISLGIHRSDITKHVYSPGVMYYYYSTRLMFTDAPEQSKWVLSTGVMHSVYYVSMEYTLSL